jgi:tetratricopeptide (TPR) repeat protein
LFPLVTSTLGAAYALSGRVAEALPLLEQAVEHAASMREVDFHSHRLACLGEAYLVAGRIDDALATAKQALEISREHKERGWEAHALRLLGDIAVQHRPSAMEQAEDYYRQAMTLGNVLGMRPLVAHCHLDLGTLHAKLGQLQQARLELATAVQLYRTMDMAFWLTKAESALVQVG